MQTNTLIAIMRMDLLFYGVLRFLHMSVILFTVGCTPPGQTPSRQKPPTLGRHPQDGN